jgi:hypothetical protein
MESYCISEWLCSNDLWQKQIENIVFWALKGYTLQYNKYELKFTEYGNWGVPGARGKQDSQSCHFSCCVGVILAVD